MDVNLVRHCEQLFCYRLALENIVRNNMAAFYESSYRKVLIEIGIVFANTEL